MNCFYDGIAVLKHKIAQKSGPGKWDGTVEVNALYVNGCTLNISSAAIDVCKFYSNVRKQVTKQGS